MNVLHARRQALYDTSITPAPIRVIHSLHRLRRGAAQDLQAVLSMLSMSTDQRRYTCCAEAARDQQQTPRADRTEARSCLAKLSQSFRTLLSAKQSRPYGSDATDQGKRVEPRALRA